MRESLLKQRLLTALSLLMRGRVFKAIDQTTTAIWMYYYVDRAVDALREIIKNHNDEMQNIFGEFEEKLKETN